MPDILRDIYEKNSGEKVDSDFVAKLLADYKAIHNRRMDEVGPPPRIDAVVAVARAHVAAGAPCVFPRVAVWGVVKRCCGCPVAVDGQVNEGHRVGSTAFVRCIAV